MIVALHHVQLAMPAGGEEKARAFYGKLMGLTERPKPEMLQNRGGCWFEDGPVRVHLGVESDFRPARKAHPGFQVSQFAALLDKFGDAGHNITYGEPIDDLARFFVDDPFGNRVEIVAMEKSL
ncbi:VOC family protein [Parasphingorhabdus halotolerans]|nr:VOC family protein [Parasphingorhabdus halotolerans]